MPALFYTVWPTASHVLLPVLSSDLPSDRSRAHQGRSQDFIPEGADLARAQGTKKRKLLGFGPLFLGPSQFICFLIFPKKNIFRSGDMAPLPPPLATSLQPIMPFALPCNALCLHCPFIKIPLNYNHCGNIASHF